ncbi:MAG TPA: YbaK/EbsC family protein, partial [Thermoplasmata archaeon]|nr:YbaK/EbsC family protein [Thermoplasmata archaeon]
MPNAPLRQSSALRVDAALRARGILDRVRELPSSTRTAAEAAQAVGCSTGQIVKSLVFRAHDSGQAILVLAAGSHRVDEDWMRRYTHQRLIRADPEFVRTVTGFAIGGVPPIGHPSTLPTYIDLDLLEEGELWAAAGHPHAICRLTARELVSLTQGRLVPVVPPVGGAPPPSRWIA